MELQELENRITRANSLYAELYTKCLIPDQMELHSNSQEWTYTRLNKDKPIEEYLPNNIEDIDESIRDQFIDYVVGYRDYYLAIDAHKHQIIDYPIINEILKKHGFEMGTWIIFREFVPHHYMKNKLVILLRDIQEEKENDNNKPIEKTTESVNSLNEQTNNRTY